MLLGSFGLTIVALVIQIIFLLKKTSKLDPITKYLVLLTGLLLLTNILYRSIVIHSIAITNMYETLVFFAGFIACITSWYAFNKKMISKKYIIFGGTLLTTLLIMLSSSPLCPSDIKPPIPALQSIWLVLHVSFTIVGESFFAVAFVTALMQLCTKDTNKMKEYDRITYTTVAIGYPIFTIGALIFGMIWAEHAWGSWWSWDPKETWALITWLVYTLYLHLRLGRKHTSKLMPALVVIGFFVAMFTFFGVNYLMSGLHSYR
ncbi:MAG: hypothetical protein BKP49_05370 [Treponema sp. CETP13]|nr:MAG: hypothetical protein BKP49_05370 [Treponema sp. CETP13]